MASWMIHLRVAQRICQQLHMTYAPVFVMGNIAPDSGVPTADGKGYVPDAALSHFRTLDANGIKDVHEEQFIARYFTPAKRQALSNQAYTFYFGYLTHLLTDKLWTERIVYPAKAKLLELFARDRAAFWRQVKRDWYDLDFLYLKEHPDFEAFAMYEGLRDFKNVYLDFFDENAFEARRQSIVSFYRNGVKTFTAHATYLSMNELDDFVAFAAEEILRQCTDCVAEIAVRGLA